MEYRIRDPFTREKLEPLRAGDTVFLTGTIYTARDAAHKRLIEMIENREPLPFEVKDAVIYYVGPTPEKPGNPIGAAGPTTSYRMDAYAPTLLDLGETAMIGKGQRSQEVKDTAIRNGAVYFAAIGGAGALMAQKVKSAEIVAFEDLGPEAVRRLQVEDFPVTVVLDSAGGDLYQEGRAAYLESRK